jgi:hypothetical protein
MIIKKEAICFLFILNKMLNQNRLIKKNHTLQKASTNSIMKIKKPKNLIPI